MKRPLLFSLFAVTLLYQGEVNTSKVNSGPDSKALVEIGGENYILAGADPGDWYEAKARCQEMNMQLVTFQTEEKWNLFVDFITAYPAFDTWFWTSGHRAINTTDFIWTTTGNTFNYTAWRSGEPDLSTSRDTCVSFLVDWGGWDDDGCYDFNYAYVCENIPT